MWRPLRGLTVPNRMCKIHKPGPGYGPHRRQPRADAAQAGTALLGTRHAASSLDGGAGWRARSTTRGGAARHIGHGVHSLQHLHLGLLRALLPLPGASVRRSFLPRGGNPACGNGTIVAAAICCTGGACTHDMALACCAEGMADTSSRGPRDSQMAMGTGAPSGLITVIRGLAFLPSRWPAS